MARWVFKGFNQSGYLICVWRQIIINERLNPVELSYGARNVLSYTGRTMQNFLSFRDSPIIPLRRSPVAMEGRKGSEADLPPPAASTNERRNGRTRS